MGLGLSIVKRLAELQNHAIQFSSKLDIGSEFSITLPATEPLVHHETSHHEMTDFFEPNQFSILVIENEKDIGEATKILLNTWGHTVLNAENSEQALSLVRSSKNDFDLMISDFQLEENITGLELCQAIQDELDHEIPIIIITGNSNPDTIKLITESNVTLLHKPIFPPQLRLSIENLLQEKKIQ